MNFCEIMKFFMRVLLNMRACDAKLLYKFHQPNSNNFNCNPVVPKNKIGKRGHFGPHPKQITIFLTETTKPDHKLSKTFYFVKILYLLAELYFSILYDAFLLKRFISIHP